MDDESLDEHKEVHHAPICWMWKGLFVFCFFTPNSFDFQRTDSRLYGSESASLCKQWHPLWRSQLFIQPPVSHFHQHCVTDLFKNTESINIWNETLVVVLLIRARAVSTASSTGAAEYLNTQCRAAVEHARASRIIWLPHPLSWTK